VEVKEKKNLQKPIQGGRGKKGSGTQKPKKT